MNINVITTIFLLLLSFFVKSISQSQQGAGVQEAENKVIVSPRTEPLAQAAVSGPLLSGDYKGRIVCSVNNARYTEAGLEWPWDNVLQMYSINTTQVKKQFYTASRSRYDFAFEPRWLNQKEFTFKIGDPVSSYGTYDLALWNSSSGNIEDTQNNLFLRSSSASIGGHFIAFVQGGRNLPFGAPIERPALAIFDRKQKTTRVLPFSLPDLSGRGWTPQNKLLYTERQTLPAEQVKKLPFTQPSIREFDPASGKFRLFRSNAFTPFVSPDGKWIAYFAFENPFPEEQVEKITTAPDPTLSIPALPLYLVIADDNGEPVSLIAQKHWDYLPILRWSADSKKVIVYERRTRKANVEGREMEGNVSSYDLESKELKKMGALRYFAPTGMEMSDEELLCRPINLTKDGQFLLFELQSITPPAGTTLTAFDLSNGTTQTWFSISAFQGLDWIED